MGADTPQRPGQGDEMTSQFDRSIALVRDYSSRFEREYIRPVVNNGRVILEERPITTTFVAIFCSLGVLPVVFFLGLSVFVFCLFIASALGVAFAVSTVLILAFFAVLVCVLTAAFFVSALLTLLALGSFIVFRLVFLLMKEGRLGISLWTEELKGYLLKTIKGNDENEKKFSVQDDSRSDSTNDSGVLIQSEKVAFEDAAFEEKSG